LNFGSQETITLQGFIDIKCSNNLQHVHFVQCIHGMQIMLLIKFIKIVLLSHPNLPYLAPKIDSNLTACEILH